MHSGKSDEFENSYPFYIFFLNPDYVAARSLRSLRSNNLFLSLGLSLEASRQQNLPAVRSFCASYFVHQKFEVCLPKKSIFFVNLRLSLAIILLYTSDVMEEGKK